ncbi:MAG: hypothetical protein AB1649_20585 [Chloroflexota bacterium]
MLGLIVNLQYAVMDRLVAAWTGLARAKDLSRWWVFLLEGLINIAAAIRLGCEMKDGSSHMTGQLSHPNGEIVNGRILGRVILSERPTSEESPLG